MRIGTYLLLAGRALPSAKLLEGLLDSLKSAVVDDDVTLVALRRLSVPGQSDDRAS